MIFVNRNTLGGIAAILLWSMTIGLGRSIAEQTGPLTAGAYVYLTGGFISSSCMMARKKSFRKIRKISLNYFFICGSLFLIYTTSLFLALGLASDRYQTLEVGLINYLWPALTIFFSLLFFRRNVSLWLIPGTLIALGGVFFTMIKGEYFSFNNLLINFRNSPEAYAIALIAAFSWAMYSNLVRLTGNSGGINAVPLFILLTGIVLWLLRIVFPEESSYSTGIYSQIIILGFATALAYYLWENAMRKGDLILVVSVSYLTPFFSTAFSALYLRITPGMHLWIGCLLIILGSWLSWKSVKLEINR